MGEKKMSRMKQGTLAFALMLAVALSGCIAPPVSTLQLTQIDYYTIDVEITLDKPYLMGRYYLTNVNVYDPIVPMTYTVTAPLPNTLTFDNRWVNTWTFTITVAEELTSGQTIYVDLELFGPTGSFMLSESFVAMA